MTVTVAIQMDHVSTIDIDGDSTFAMALEAQKRGYALFHFEPQGLSLSNGRVIATGQPLELRREKGNHFTLGEYKTIDLATESGVVLMRQDPPFDMSYITATHFLEMVHPETLVVNNPREVRNAPEKLFVTEFPQYMPATLITRDRAQVTAFRKEHKDNLCSLLSRQ